MDTYADNIPGCNGVHIQRFQGFVTQNGVAKLFRCRSRENKQPTRCNDGGPKAVSLGLIRCTRNR